MPLVGGGGGSGFQYTVSNVGFCYRHNHNIRWYCIRSSRHLILGPIGGAAVAQGTGLTATIGSITSVKQFEKLSQAGTMTLGATGDPQVLLLLMEQLLLLTTSVAPNGKP